MQLYVAVPLHGILDKIQELVNQRLLEDYQDEPPECYIETQLCADDIVEQFGPQLKDQILTYLEAAGFQPQQINIVSIDILCHSRALIQIEVNHDQQRDILLQYWKVCDIRYLPQQLAEV